MKDIVQYRIVCSRGDYTEVVKKVNELIKEGFEPFGSVSTTSDDERVTFSQAMVKYSDEG